MAPATCDESTCRLYNTDKVTIYAAPHHPIGAFIRFLHPSYISRVSVSVATTFSLPELRVYIPPLLRTRIAGFRVSGRHEIEKWPAIFDSLCRLRVWEHISVLVGPTTQHRFGRDFICSKGANGKILLNK